VKKPSIKTRRHAPKTIILAAFLLALAAGCENNGKKPAPPDRIKNLQQENTRLTQQFEQARAENEQLKEQVRVLAGLRDEVEVENLYLLRRIKITRYTNFYDRDKDGQKEKLIVYIQPMDDDGDIIKAAGAVDVQLWDLNKKGDEALLGQWHVKHDELKKLWFATLVTTNYRLTFDMPDKVKDFKDPLTIKVTFTDYLTGRVFQEQKVIKPL
jgi:hypothetical protein